GATPPEQLRELRKILLTALLAGETPDDIGLREFVGEPAGGAEEEIAQLGDAPPPPPSRNRVARRTTFIPEVDQFIGAPQWAWAQSPRQTLGPFQDRGGRLHWFDVFSPGAFFVVLVQGGAAPVALLPQGTAPAPAGGTLTLPPGSVWLNASSIHPSAPAGSWAGLRITGGTATPAGPVQVGAGGLLLRPQGGVTLRLKLDTQNLAGFPESVTIAVSANGIRVSEFDPGSMTAFGGTVSFTPGNGAPAFNSSLRSILFPLAPEPGTFTATADPGTELFPMSGSAGIQSAAWAVPVTTELPGALADAKGPGALAVTMEPGFEVALPGTAGGSIALNATTILVTPGHTTVFAGAATNPRATQTLEAWFEDRVVRRSTIELNRAASFPCWYFHLESGAEAVLTRAQVTMHIDRPMRASGERLESRIAALHLLERDEAGSRIALRGRQQIGEFQPFALALPNALLTVADPVLLELNAMLSAPGEMRSGALHLALPLYQLLPTLPDPYAANFDLKTNIRADDGTRVVATVIWTEPFDAHLDITLDPSPFNMQALGSVLPNPRTLRAQDDLTQSFSDLTRHQVDQGLVLLDVSSNAGQLGVALGFGDRPQGALYIRDLTLHVAGSNATVFLLPQFQCEPVFNKANPRVPGDTEKTLFFSDDGGPSLAAADAVRLVQVRPVALLAEVVNAYSQDKHNAAVRFTLPFGIQAVALLNPLDRQFSALPQLQIGAPRYADFEGAPQLALVARTQTGGQVWIAGQALQVQNVTSSPPPSVLGAVIGPAFNTAFKTGVPVDRIGLSGYGANIFSRWFLAQKDADIGITQVAFDAFHGRTAFERIMLTSYLLPCCARVVRTITLERYGNGAVVRWDSGWLATTPGLFDHQNFAPRYPRNHGHRLHRDAERWLEDAGSVLRCRHRGGRRDTRRGRQRAGTGAAAPRLHPTAHHSECSGRRTRHRESDRCSAPSRVVRHPGAAWRPHRLPDPHWRFAARNEGIRRVCRERVEPVRRSCVRHSRAARRRAVERGACQQQYKLGGTR
ncbi:MAG: hypothetical protein NTW28_17745, partial [Candidatus Solibacter sp.]|nr:hypothetical protein [Candidatus Solibacter sp.]